MRFFGMPQVFAGCQSVLKDQGIWFAHGFFLSNLLRFFASMPVATWQIPYSSHRFQIVRDRQSRSGIELFEMLKDAWHYALRRFVHDKKWTKDDVNAYFTLLCINKGTIDHFT
jgi:hypothetical protein